ncbi:MAG: hypothetical protein HQK60_18145 [Deltaproteobacteria bacterium]|nr:hypothetical protein [Deltaproteobacteria bacterium]
MEIYLDKYGSIVDGYETFMSSPPVSHGDYDCLLMLSGGKDSMFMLNKLTTETSKRIIAYTYDHPYESKYAIDNIKEIGRLIDVDYISFASHAKYKKMMRKVFLSVDKASVPFKAEKIPCAVCSSYLIATACLMAIDLKVPYVLYCADPVQMLGVEHELKKMIQSLAFHLGLDFLEELLGRKAVEILEQDSLDLPLVVFPYVSMMGSYDREAIITDVKKLGKLRPSSIGTMCSLYPLLEYYSYKNYDCCIDSLELAAGARNGALPRDTLISMIGEYRKIILEIAVKDRLGDQDMAAIRDFTRKVHPESEVEAELLCHKIVSLRPVAQELGILNDFLVSEVDLRSKEEDEFLRSTRDIGEDF